MAELPVNFSKTAAKRITTVVNDYEGRFINGRSKDRSQAPLIVPVQPFLAKIMGRDYDAKTYSWRALKPTDSGTFDEDLTFTGTTSDNPAREVTDFMFVENDSIVLLTPYFDHNLFIWGDYTVNGITDEHIDLNDTGTVRVYFDTTDTEETIEAKNRYHDLEADKNVQCKKIGALWFIDAGEC